jgi:methyl-accepting chemotaxis protein WspA
MSIKQKMLSGFGITLAILALIALITFMNLLSIKNASINVVENQQPTVIQSLKLAEKLKETLGSLGFYLLSKEESHKENYIKQLGQTEKLIKGLKQQTSIKEDENATLLVNQIEKDYKEFQSFQQRMFEFAASDQENFPGMSYSSQNINPLSQRILQNINTMISAEEEEEKRAALIKELNNLRYSWTRIMNGVRAFLGFRTPAALAEIANYESSFTTELDTIAQKFGDKLGIDQEESLSKIKTFAEEYKKHIEVVKELHGGDEWRQDAYTIRSQITPLLEKLNSAIDQLVNKQVANIEEISGSLTSKATDTSTIAIVLLLAAMACVALLAYLLMSGIITPMTTAVSGGIDSIRKVMDNFSEENRIDINDIQGDDAINSIAVTFDVMSNALEDAITTQQMYTETLKSKVNKILDVVRKAAEGDLTAELDKFAGDDAIDELGNNVLVMMENLNTLVAQVQDSGIQVTSSATEIAATAKQQEATVSEQAASTNEIMATVTEISATSKELVHTMQEVSQVSESTAESAVEGQDALNRMEATMKQMREATNSITSKLAVLSEKAGNINNVVTTINKVADQTNLLSLNAAIEAEKAGEYGRGFAVVATEIRRLADQTAVATWDIEQMVKEMQSAVSAGVMGMDKFSVEVSNGVDEIAQVGGQLGHIIDQVQTLTPRFESVTQGMQSQSQGGEQITESMVQLNETAQQTAESLRQSNTSIQQLKDAAQQLQHGVSKFKISQ